MATKLRFKLDAKTLVILGVVMIFFANTILALILFQNPFSRERQADIFTKLKVLLSQSRNHDIVLIGEIPGYKIREGENTSLKQYIDNKFDLFGTQATLSNLQESRQEFPINQIIVILTDKPQELYAWHYDFEKLDNPITSVGVSKYDEDSVVIKVQVNKELVLQQGGQIDWIWRFISALNEGIYRLDKSIREPNSVKNFDTITQQRNEFNAQTQEELNQIQQSGNIENYPIVIERKSI